MTKTPFLNIFLLLVVATLITFTLVFFLFPVHRPHLIEEDLLVENITVLFYFATALIAFYGLLSGKSRYRKTLMFLLGISVFAALEEMSYGERLVGFTAPRVLDYKMDTLHDFFFLSLKTVKVLFEQHGAIILIVSGLLTIAGLILLYTAWGKYSSRLKPLLNIPAYFYLLAFVILGFTALIFDLGLIKHDYMKVLEEGMEFNASVALLFSVLTTYIPETVKNE